MAIVGDMEGGVIDMMSLAHGQEQALSEMRPLLDRFWSVPADDPAAVTLDILARMNRWFDLFGMPKTATESYSPGGWRPTLGAWPSISHLVAHLYEDMGGGVPIELLQAMVVLAHDEWAATSGTGPAHPGWPTSPSG